MIFINEIPNLTHAPEGLPLEDVLTPFEWMFRRWTALTGQMRIFMKPIKPVRRIHDGTHSVLGR